MAQRRLVLHITFANRRWWVQHSGQREYRGDFSGKKLAVVHACSYAKARPPSQVVVHKRDGTIQTEYTYGADPRKTKG